MSVKEITRRKKMLKYAQKMMKYVRGEPDYIFIKEMLERHSKSYFEEGMSVFFDGSRVRRVDYTPKVEGIILRMNKQRAKVKTKKYGKWNIPYSMLTPMN